MPASLNGIPYALPTDAVSSLPATSMALAQYLTNVPIESIAGLRTLITVSYTHLTLPTIYSV